MTLLIVDDNDAAIPPNLIKRRWIHVAMDKVEINEYTLDGK